MVKDPPATEAEFTVTGDVPVELSVNDWLAVVLRFTLPKLRLEVLSDNCGFAAAVPVPLKATVAVLPLAELLLIVSCPVAAPAAVGRNFSCKVSDSFGASDTG